MSAFDELKQFESDIQRCVRCGSCQTQCPVYNQTHHEGGVARGKLALAKALLQGEIDLEKRFLEDFSLCLMCGSCTAKCPNKVPTDKIVGAMRRLINQEQGLSLNKRLITGLTGSPALMRTLGKTAGLISPALFSKIPESSGLRLRFPLPKQKNRTFPEIAGKNLFELFPEFSQGHTDKETLGVFSGCAISYLYPDIGLTMLKLLAKLGYTIHFPHNQGCCSLPAQSAGHARLIESLSEKNSDLFSHFDLDCIVTACASCHSGLQGLKKPLSDKVQDILVFLDHAGLPEHLSQLPDRGKNKIRVSYHDPCHHRSQGIGKEPRRLLQALPHVDYIEMEGADLCCGLGGTFSVDHYGLSKAIGNRKLDGIKNSGADIIATACPGCIIQLRDICSQNAIKTKVVHVLDLIHEALIENNY